MIPHFTVFVCNKADVHFVLVLGIPQRQQFEIPERMFITIFSDEFRRKTHKIMLPYHLVHIIKIRNQMGMKSAGRQISQHLVLSAAPCRAHSDHRFLCQITGIQIVTFGKTVLLGHQGTQLIFQQPLDLQNAALRILLDLLDFRIC